LVICPPTAYFSEKQFSALFNPTSALEEVKKYNPNISKDRELFPFTSLNRYGAICDNNRKPVLHISSRVG
jgi:hypothetical protein